MGKSIKIFLSKIEGTQEGSLKGGFASIRGGFGEMGANRGSNETCTNM